MNRYAVRLNTVAVVCENFEPRGKDGNYLGKHADMPESSAKLIADLLATVDQDVETFGFLALDSRHHVIGFKLLTLGTHNQAPVDVAKLFRVALALGACGLIVFHNHPSNDLEPSRDDIDLTTRLVAGGRVIGIAVHDHIIAGIPGRWLSLRSARPNIF